MARLSGRTAIVTGGAVGIGRHYSQSLAAEGAQVMIADIKDGAGLAAEIAARPRTSILEIKRCVYEGIELPMEEALRFEQQAFNRTMRSDDASRLMKAYLQSARPLNEQ